MCLLTLFQWKFHVPALYVKMWRLLRWRREDAEEGGEGGGGEEGGEGGEGRKVAKVAELEGKCIYWYGNSQSGVLWVL